MDEHLYNAIEDAYTYAIKYGGEDENEQFTSLDCMLFRLNGSGYLVIKVERAPEDEYCPHRQAVDQGDVEAALLKACNDQRDYDTKHGDDEDWEGTFEVMEKSLNDQGYYFVRTVREE